MFIAECLTFNRNVGADANLTLGRLVAGFPWIWDELWPLFPSFFLRWDGLHWVSPSCTTCGVLDAICLFHCLAKNVVAPGFTSLYHQGIVRRDNLLSSLLVRRFLRVVKDHGVALILLRLVHLASLSPPHESWQSVWFHYFREFPLTMLPTFVWHWNQRLCWVWWICLYNGSRWSNHAPWSTLSESFSLVEIPSLEPGSGSCWNKSLVNQNFVRDPWKCLCAFRTCWRSPNLR